MNFEATSYYEVPLYSAHSVLVIGVLLFRNAGAN